LVGKYSGILSTDSVRIGVPLYRVGARVEKKKNKGLMFRKHDGKTFAGIASIPERSLSLKHAIDSIYEQVDKIGVYLNNYESVPDFLLRKKIIVVRSQDYGDRKDNGKFHFLSQSREQYYAALDDDIIYPTDYIVKLIESLKSTGPESAVGVHGSLLPNPINSITHFRYVFHYERSTPFISRVDILGTGTVMFDQRFWKLKTQEFIDVGMSDVWFARAANKRGYPMFIVNRNRGWLNRSPFIINNDANLFSNSKKNQDVQLSLLQRNNTGGSIEKVLSAITPRSRLLSYFSISHLLQVLYIAKTLGWPRARSEFYDQFLNSLELEILSETSSEKSRSLYLSVVRDITHNRVSFETVSTFISWVSLVENEPELQSLYRMKFDSKPARVSKILEALTSKVCDSWFAESKKPSRTQLETVLKHVPLEYFQNLGRLTNNTSIFSAIRGRLDSGLATIEAAKQIGAILSALRSEMPEIKDDFWNNFADSSPDVLEVGLVGCLGLVYSGESQKALTLSERLITKIGFSDDILILQHLISEYSQPKSSETPASLMELITNNCFAGISGDDPIHSINRGSERMPRVTVIMTARNPGSDALSSMRHLIDSSLIKNLEIICVDDGSEVDFTQGIKDLHDPRVTVVRIEKSINIYNARNLAIEMSSGEFISFLDAGDFSMPGRLYLQAKELERNPTLQAVKCQGIRFDASGLPVLENNTLFLGEPPASLMFRRDVVGKIGSFLPVPSRGDVEFIGRIKAFFGEGSVALIRKPLYLASSPKNSLLFNPSLINQFKYATNSWHEMIRSDPRNVQSWLENQVLPVPIPEFR
jgi:hypothetical protein